VPPLFKVSVLPLVAGHTESLTSLLTSLVWSLPHAKASGCRRRHYRVNTRHHRVFTARLAAVGWDGAVCVAARGESKVNVMGGPTAMTADSTSSLLDHPLRTSKYRLNLAIQIVDLAVIIDRRFLATSDPLNCSGIYPSQFLVNNDSIYRHIVFNCLALLCHITNHMELVHWPLLGQLLHLCTVHWGVDWMLCPLHAPRLHFAVPNGLCACANYHTVL